MPTQELNGVEIFYETRGDGRPTLVLVHGSWSSHRGWDQTAPLLADSFTVYRYDRRGHSESERPAGQGSIQEDVADLEALIRHFDLAPAWVVASSFGGNIALRFAASHSALLQGLILHEPPLLALMKGDPNLESHLDNESRKMQSVAERIAAGDHAGGAKAFVETVALGPGAWDQVPSALRQILTENAPTFLDEVMDPGSIDFDPAWVETFDKPVLLTQGTQSPQMFRSIVAKLAPALGNVEHRTFEGAGHIPHITHPTVYANVVGAFVRANSR